MAKIIKRTSRAVAASRHILDQLIALPAAHLDQLAELLSARLRPHLPEGVAMPDIRLILKLILSDLRWTHSLLISSDQGRVEEATEQVQARIEMENSEEILRGRIRFTRTAVQTSYGKAGLDCIPFNAAEARTIDGLVDQGEYILQRLPDLEGRKPILPEGQGDSAIGLSPPPAILVDALRPRIVDLKEKRRIYLEVTNNSRMAVSEKKENLAKFEYDARQVREIFKRLFLLVDREELADLLKVTRRTSRGGENEEGGNSVDSVNDPPTGEHVA